MIFSIIILGTLLFTLLYPAQMYHTFRKDSLFCERKDLIGDNDEAKQPLLEGTLYYQLIHISLTHILTDDVLNSGIEVIDYDEIIMKETIARGGVSSVYRYFTSFGLYIELIQHRGEWNGQNVAVKKIVTNADDFIKEVKILRYTSQKV
jgi:hypothetical protein